MSIPIKARGVKHQYWIAQFKDSLPVYLAERYVETNQTHIQNVCMTLGVDKFLAYSGGTYAKAKLGEWAVSAHEFTDEVLNELRNGSNFDNDLFDLFYYDGLKRRKLEEQLTEVLGAFLITTNWWKDNLQYVRKECGTHSLLKGVMES